MCESKLQHTNIQLRLIRSTCSVVSYLSILHFLSRLWNGIIPWALIAEIFHCQLVMKVLNPSSFCHGDHIMQAHKFCCSHQFDTVPVTSLDRGIKCVSALMWMQCDFLQLFTHIFLWVVLLPFIGLQPLVIRQHAKFRHFSKLQVFDLWKQKIISKS